MDSVINEAKTGNGKLCSGDTVVTKKDMIMLGNEMIKIIKGCLPSSVASAGGSLTVETPMGDPSGGDIVRISFSGDLSRKSIFSKKYPEGIDNIVALFNNGYVANDYVYGNRKEDSEEGSFYNRSKIGRPSENFMQSAVEKFNSTYGDKYNVVAELNEVYGDSNAFSSLSDYKPPKGFSVFRTDSGYEHR